MKTIIPQPAEITIASCKCREDLLGFVRLPTILKLLPISKSQLWEMIGRGDFPRPVKLSARVSAWKVESLRAWIESRVNACC